MRGLLGELPANGDEVVLLDMEASIEHMSRGTPRHVDAMLIVTEPYYRSLETTGRLAPLARELGIPRVLAVANKLRGDRDHATIADYCARHQIDLIAAVPFDERAAEADREGRAVLDAAPDAPAVRAVQALAASLRDQVLAGGANGP